MRRLTLLLSGLAMLGPFATDTYLPSFPAMSHAFGVSDAVMQQSLSVYLLAYAAMSLLHGPLSDALGRRPVILGALAVFLFGSVGAAAAQDFPQLLACRALQGLSAGAGMVVGQAIIRDRFQGAAAHRLVANVMMIFGVAPALAPIIGGWLEVTTGWRSSFGLMAVLTLVLLVSCALGLAESLPREQRQPLRFSSLAGGYRTALSDGRFLAGCLAIAFAFSGFALYISASSAFVTTVLGLPATGFGWLFLPLVGGLMIGSWASGRLATRWPARRVLILGAAVMVAGALINIAAALSAPGKLPFAVAPLLIYSVGLALVLPGMTVTTLGRLPAVRGLAASLQSFAQMLVFAVVAGSLASVLGHSALKLSLGAAGGVALGLGLWFAADPGRAPRASS